LCGVVFLLGRFLAPADFLGGAFFPGGAFFLFTAFFATLFFWLVAFFSADCFSAFLFLAFFFVFRAFFSAAFFLLSLSSSRSDFSVYRRGGGFLRDGRFLAPEAFFVGGFLLLFFSAKGFSEVWSFSFFRGGTMKRKGRRALTQWCPGRLGSARPVAGLGRPSLHWRAFYLRTMAFSPDDFLDELRLRGAVQLRRVRFRDNRSRIWSLTRGGTVLNLHRAFRRAPSSLIDAFALLVMQRGPSSPATRRAADRIRDWPPLREALREARERHARRSGRLERPPHGCGTEEQRAYLNALFRYFNQTRFRGALPADIPLRLSRRMTSALGHMRPGEAADGTRFVAEIALNVDLLLPGNGAERVDTLLHEMAHAADYLESGCRGHGASWRAWARRVGCRPTTLNDRAVTYRKRRRDRVRRVPPLPLPLRPD